MNKIEIPESLIWKIINEKRTASEVARSVYGISETRYNDIRRDYRLTSMKTNEAWRKFCL